jgi:exosortase N
MIRASSISLPRLQDAKPLTIPLAYGLLTIATLGDYLSLLSVRFICGLLALYFVTEKRSRPASTNAQAIICILLVALSLLAPVKTFLFFSFSFALGHYLQRYFRLGGLWLLVVLLMSPATTYGLNVFSFPIRLLLTEWTGHLLLLLDKTVQVQGNVIEKQGGSFSVDPACMGLHLLETSMLTGVIFWGYYRKKLQRAPAAWAFAVYFCAILLLNLASNITRILLLVSFSILPDDPLHQLTGMMTLIVYVGIPASLLAKWLVRNGRPMDASARAETSVRQGRRVPDMVLLALCMLAAWRVLKADPFAEVGQLTQSSIDHYQIAPSGPGVLKLTDDKSLVYLKFIQSFYGTDHNPTICWKGSGYEFGEARSEAIGGQQVYTATLHNGSEQLCTAWWYSNGPVNTVNQWNWRWQMLRTHTPFCVVNVTAASASDLRLAVAQMLARHVVGHVIDSLPKHKK